MANQATVWAVSESNPGAEHIGRDEQQNATNREGPGNHLFTTDCIKERSQQQRTAEIADRQNKEVKADLLVRDIVKMGKYQAECEED